MWVIRTAGDRPGQESWWAEEGGWTGRPSQASRFASEAEALDEAYRALADAHARRGVEWTVEEWRPRP
jgi:hypothetical protein